MANIYFTVSEIKKLTTNIEEKYTELTGNKLSKNSYKASYTELADLINEKMGVNDVIKNSWLQTLFYYKKWDESKGKNEYRINLLFSFCEVKMNKNEYGIDKVSDFLTGEYQLFYQTTSLSHNKIKQLSKGTVSLSSDGTTVVVDENDLFFSIDKKSISGVEYHTLLKEEKEMLFLTLQKGLFKQDELDVISGIFSTVDQGMVPTSGLLLLIKKDKKISDSFIQNYFNKYDYSSLKPYGISEMTQRLKIEQQSLSLKTSNTETRKQGLYGHWYMVYDSRKKGKMKLAHLHITKDEIMCETAHNYYATKNMNILDKKFLMFSLNTNTKFNTLILDILRSGNTDHLDTLMGSFVTTSHLINQSSSGVFLLFRVKEDKPSIPINLYPYSKLKDLGIQADLIPLYADFFKKERILSFLSKNLSPKNHSQLTEKIAEQKRIKGFSGKWFVISNSSYENDILVLSHLELGDSPCYQTTNNDYDNVEVEIKSATNLIIELNNNYRKLLLMFKINNTNKTYKIQQSAGTFISTGSQTVVCGQCVMIKTKEFNIEVGKYTKEELSKLGINENILSLFNEKTFLKAPVIDNYNPRILNE